MRAAKVDKNHGEIVKALRQVGATVHSTAGIGGNFPDLAVGFRGRTFLFEVEGPSRERLSLASRS